MTMRSRHRFIVGVCLVGLSSGVISGEAFAGTVTGTVRDSVSNAVLSGVLVKVNQQSGKQATSNTSGVYSIASVAAGTVTLNASKAAYIAQNSGNVIVPASGTVTAPVILLVKMGTITGKVVNASGGAAVASATVTVTGTSTSTTTNSSGNFTLYQPTGTVTLTIAKTGWVSEVTGNVSVTNNQTTAAGNIQITQNGTLSGKVVNALGAAAISGATVTASPGGATATTSSTGAFSFSIAPGSYTLTVTKSGWISRTTSAYAVTSNTTTATGNISISQSAISGTVVAAAGGAPVPGATVKVSGTSNSTTTDAAGTFHLSLAPSTVTLTVTKASWRNLVTGNTTTTGGQTSNVGSLTLVETATVNGYVKDSSSGTGISGATIVLTGDVAVTTTTNGAGSFTLANVPLGNRSLDVSATNYQSLTTPVFAVSSGSNAIPDILLGSGFGSINGTVKDASTDFPLVGALVQLTSDTGIAAETDSLGQFQLTNVPSGTQTLAVSRGWYQALESESFSVVGGSPTAAPALSISPLPSGISGHVYLPGATDPLEGATITLARTGQSVASGADGSFAFSGLAAGYEYVLVSKPGYRQVATAEIYLDPDGTPDIAFELSEIDPSYSVGLIHGFVLDASGNPLPGASVTAIGLPPVISGADGSYAVTAPYGSYVVRAEKAGHLTQLSRWIPGPGYFSSPWQAPISFRLPSLGATGTLTVNTIEPISRVGAAGEQILRTLSGLYIVRTSATGSRTLSSFPAGVVFSGWTVPTVIPAGGVASVSLDAWPALPQVSPHWAAAGQVLREFSRTPIPSASVVFSNPGAAFSTTLTTDSDGRFGLAGAPLGEYSVTATGPGLPVSNPWTFTATDDSYQGTAGFLLRDPAEEGQLSVTSPLPDVIVTSSEWAVSAQASNLAPEDYVVNVWADVSGCAVESVSPTYGPNGRAFDLSFTASCSSGPSTLVVYAVTANGLVVQTSVPVTIANPPRISNLDLGSPTVLGGLILNGSVSLVEQAPVGGAVISLSSDSAAATVPATIAVAAGSSWASFQTVTRPVSASTMVQVTASNAAGSVSQALEVVPATASSSVMGHIYQAGTQTPIPNAVVTLARTGQSVTTDAAGSYSFEGLLPGWDNLVISGPGLRHNVTNEIFINAGDAFVDLNLGIEPVDATMPDGVLWGTVRDSSGAPLAGATVTAPGLSSALTGVDGRYQIAVPAGAYVIRAEKVGYLTQLCRRHQGPGYYRTAWEIWQDFTLPTIDAIGTVEVTTIEPVSGVAGPGADWLRSLFGLYPVETPAAGTRVITGFPAGRFYDNRGFPVELLAGGAVSLSVDGSAVIPGTPPSWAAAGIVRRTASHEPVSGASIVLENPSASFSTTVTTDENGRFSLAGGPVGDYSVSGSSPGLPAFGPWSFNAANDGGLRGVAQFDVRDPAEDGSLSITAPGPGAVLASSTWTLSAVATLPIPDDYVVNVSAEVPNCTVGAASATYQPGGRAFSVSLPVSCLAGDRTVTLSVITRNDAVLAATVPITVQNPAGVQEVSLVAPSILGGIPVGGTVTLSEAAPAGGKVVSLTSDRTDIATAPASVLVPEGSTSATFVVVTVPVVAAAQALITASVDASTASAILQVRPNTVQQLTLGSGSVSGGSNTSGLVRVGEPAPAAGTIVVLESSQPAVASVPGTVTVTQGQTTAGFTVATAPVLVEASSIISASIGSSTASQTVAVRASAPAGEISEGNAASWAAVATDSATATLIDDSSRAAMGSSSLKLTSSSVAETGWAFPGSGSLHWDLSGRTFLSFWMYVPEGGPTLASGQPVVVLTCAGGSYRYEPASALITMDGWRRYDVPIVPAESQWIRSPSGTPSLTDVVKIEIRLRPQSAGLTAWLDGVAFASALVGDLAEGNATGWGTFSSDAASASVTDSSLNVRSGASSLLFTTTSGFDSGLMFLADGLAHWNLSDVDSLSFWMTPTNSNYPGFQGNLPIVVLKTPSGSYRYEPAGTLMNSGVTRLYQIPLAGGGPWTRTATGAPGLQDVNQVEFHFDTWGNNYTLSVDGVTFGKALPYLTFSPRPVTAGQQATGTIALGQPAPAGGAVATVVSADPVATVPATVTIAEGSLSATFVVSTEPVPTDTAPRISWSWNGQSAEALLIIKAQPGALAGTVVNGVTGQPVAGVIVTLIGGSGTATTDGTGTFSISCGPGSYSLNLTQSGWVSATAGPYSVTAGQITGAGSLSLTPPGTLTGVVVDLSTGAPVESASVHISFSGGGFNLSTDSSGRFSKDVTAGTYSIGVGKSGYTNTYAGPFSVSAGLTADVGTLLLPRLGTLTGIVVDSSTGAPVASTWVRATNAGGSVAVQTDGTGRFTLSVSAGSFVVSLSRPGYTNTEAGSFVVSPGQTTDTGTLLFPRFGTLTGVVVDLSTGAPVGSARVAATSTVGSFVVYTDGAGRFSFDGSAGSYAVALSLSGYAPTNAGPFAVAAGQTTDAGTILFPRYATVTGTVVSAATNQPLTGATISANGTTVALTGAAGTFSATQVPAGTSTISVSAAGYNPVALAPVTLAGGQSLDIGTVALSVGGTITGRVVSGTQWDVLGSATVTVKGTANYVRTDSSGFFSIRQASGTCQLTASAGGYEIKTTAPIAVVAEQTIDIGTVSLRRLGTLQGTVKDIETGLAVGGATVKSLDGGEETTTAADGSFVLTSPYHSVGPLVVSAAGYFADHFAFTTSRDYWVTNLGTLTLSPANGTRIMGTISQDTTWDMDGNPFVLDDVTVAAGVTVTVRPGVIVRMDPRATLTVRGRLQAIGTPTSRIEIRSFLANPGAGEGYSIVFDSGDSPPSELAWMNFANLDAMKQISGTAVVDKSTFSGFGSVGPGHDVPSQVAGLLDVRRCDLAALSGGVLGGPNVSAPLNYWGDPSGPSGSGPGIGRRFSGTSFSYEPWLLSPPGADLELTSAEIKNRIFNPTIGILGHLSFAMSIIADWNVTVFHENGSPARTFAGSGTTGAVAWDGTDSAGVLVADGTYAYRITATAGALSAATATGRFVIDSSMLLQFAGGLSRSTISFHSTSPFHSSTLAGSLSFPDASWTLSVRNGSGTVLRSATGTGSVSFLWDGRDDGGAPSPDGTYNMELLATDDAVTVPWSFAVIVDSTPPVPVLSSPIEGSVWSNMLRGGATSVAVTGGFSEVHPRSWDLAWAPGANPPSNTVWRPVSSGSGAKADGALGAIETLGFANGVYSIRLKADDTAMNEAETTIQINVGNVTVSQSAEEFNPGAGQTVTYTSHVPFPLHFNLNLRNEAGQIVRHLIDSQREQGTFQDAWDGRDDAGVIVPGGAYFYSATASDGANTFSWDLSGEAVDGAAYSQTFPSDREFDPFNNQPITLTYSFPKPSRIYVVFNPTGHNHLGCRPPGYCDKVGVYESSGPHTITWAGVEASGVLRRDLGGGAVIGSRETFSKNTVVVYGREVTVSNIRVTPPYFTPASGPQTVSFDFSAPVGSVGDVAVVIRSAETGNLMRTLTRAGQAAGHVELPWDGRADGNGLPLVPGPYAVTVTVTDPAGQKAHGSILTTIAY